jgi:hypothetical protein
LIDFDRAHSDSRKSDLAYMAWLWLIGPEDEGSPPFESRLEQLSVLLRAYGLDDRRDFAEAIEAEQEEILALALEHGNRDGPTGSRTRSRSCALVQTSSTVLHWTPMVKGR